MNAQTTFLFSLLLIFAFSCKQNNEVLKEKEWFAFIDSVSCIPIPNNQHADSVSLYYMKPNTPEVLATPKFIIWKDAQALKFGEFNLFIPQSAANFLVISYRKRSLSLCDIQIGAQGLKVSNAGLLNLNAVHTDKKLSDPCNEISSVERKKSKNGNVLKVEIHQSCLGTYMYKELVIFGLRSYFWK
jgi:hypothetical protein